MAQPKLPNTEKALLLYITAAKDKLAALRLDAIRARREYGQHLLSIAAHGQIVLLAKTPPLRLWSSSGAGTHAKPRFHDLKPGDTLKLESVQPRAGRLWAKKDKWLYCFESFEELAVLALFPDELTAAVAFAAKCHKVFTI